MVHVMISLDADKQKLLRRLARGRYGDKHGAVSAVVVDGLQELEKQDRQMLARSRLVEMMRKGFEFGLKGRKAYEKRSEIYER